MLIPAVVLGYHYYFKGQGKWRGMAEKSIKAAEEIPNERNHLMRRP